MTRSTYSKEYRAVLAHIRLARENAGLSQRALATALSVPPSWVAKVESGERRIDFVEFYWLIKACEQNPLEACQQLLRQFDAAAPVGKRGR
jgi:transcriptional regulator with XRE-family HTH domain